jgi:hypothetical protein
VLRRLILSFVTGFSAAAFPLAAQTTDVIRGRIIAPDSSPVANARITVTSVGGNVSRQARTDAQGRYTVTFPGGDGDYFVSIAAIGFAGKRFELKRTADQDVLIADAKLQLSAANLDPVEVMAPRDRVRRTDVPPDISGTEQALGGNMNAVAADQWGDLAAMAASLPGVSLVPGQDGGANGYSVMGLGADQNNATLNGLGFGGAGLPRDAAVSSALVTSPYDVSRGGFAGGQTQLRTRPGSNFRARGSSFNLDAPPLQYADAAARQLGQRFTNASWGGLFSGPVAIDKAFYSMSYQLGRRLNDFRTVVNTDPAGLAAAGLSADSARRFLQVLNGLGVPATRSGLPTDRTFDNASVLAAVDLMPPSSTSGQAFNVTANGSWNSQAPLSFASTEVPTASGQRDSWRGGLQGRHSAFAFGILTETSAGFSASDAEATPYLLGPAGRVRVNSDFDDGSNALSTLQFGGSPFFNNRQRTSGGEVLNQLSWFSRNSRHRLKLTSELRTDAWHNDVAQNVYGTFLFNSLGDLQAGRPLAYQRELTRRVHDARQINGAVSLGDSWRVAPTLQVQAGLRMDAQQFTTAPLENAALDTLFGLANSTRPNRVYWSPRVGFSWTVGQAAQVSAFDGAFRAPRAVIRGGIGVFQNMLATPSIGNTLVNTGLASGQQQLTCTGAAVPVPDWSGWIANPGAVPGTCVGGGGVFSNAAPNVTAYAREFQAPRSMRGNVQWSGAVLGNRFQLTADATWSENRNQTGLWDRNVRDSTQFTLANEAGRPVFVRPTSIFPVNGAIASRDAIVTPRFNRVQEIRSDLASTTRQLSLNLAPTQFSQTWSWGLSYVLSRFDDEVPGFASTVGSPFAVDRARSSGDARHQVVLNLSYNFFDAVRVSWFSSFRSGTPYTPLVQGDINGDGYSNDRAFIPDPATVSDPQVAAGLRSLLNSGSPGARACLARQLGALAGRSSCEGPWTANANLSVGLNPVKFGLPYRMSLSFQVSNPLGAADLLMNGASRLRGWGQPAMPDPALFYVRGFDPVTRRFSYEVNQRFGATDPARTAFRAPVTVTVLARFDFAPTRERQQLVQSLDRGRTAPGQKMPEAMLRAIYAQGGIQNPFGQLLRQQDTLKLTADQADSIATVNRWYAIRLDSIWSPVTRALGGLPDRYNRADVLERYQRAREATVDLLRRIAPPVRALLTDDQQRKLPPAIAAYLDARFLASIRPGTVSFTGGGLGVGGGAPVGGPGMGGPTVNMIIR